MTTDTRKMTSPRTQTTYTVGRVPASMPSATNWPWITTCDTHLIARPSRTRSEARAAVNTPEQWCNGCDDAPTPSPARSHGGYRPGAGRKPSLGSGDRVQVVTREEQISNEKRPARSFTILSEHSEMIDRWADTRCNGNASAALREMLKTASSQIGAGS